MTMPPAGGAPPWSPNQQPGFGAAPSGSSNRRRWILLGVAVAVVVAVIVGLLVRKATPSQGPGTNADNGVDRTVGLLRETDPVCDEWTKFADELSKKEEQWAAVDDSIPALRWTPDQRETFFTAREAMAAAANQYEEILPQARDVVMQQLIAQTVVYLRAYVERVPDYVESDGWVAGVATNFNDAVTYMCTAVPVVPAAGANDLESTSSTPDPAVLNDFMATRDPQCDAFSALIDRQTTVLQGWGASDSTIPAAQWSPEQRALNDAMRKVLTQDLVEFRQIEVKAQGRIFGDLLATQNAYMQAYADAIPTYTPDDNQLWRVAIAIGGGLGAACEARL